MPQYYFHLRTSAGEVRDVDGFELPDLRCARIEARCTLLAMELDRSSDEIGIKGISITDDSGRVLSEHWLELTESFD